MSDYKKRGWGQQKQAVEIKCGGGGKGSRLLKGPVGGLKHEGCIMKKM